MEDALGEATRQPRVRSLLVGAFALLALLLASIGIHDLVAADVAARWNEFGIRLALGGSLTSLRRSIISKTAKMVALGLLLGALGVYASSNVTESAIAGLQPARLITGLIAVCLLAISAFAAILWPMLRLARVDPVMAIRRQ